MCDYCCTSRDNDLQRQRSKRSASLAYVVPRHRPTSPTPEVIHTPPPATREEALAASHTSPRGSAQRRRMMLTVLHQLQHDDENEEKRGCESSPMTSRRSSRDDSELCSLPEAHRTKRSASVACAMPRRHPVTNHDILLPSQTSPRQRRRMTLALLQQDGEDVDENPGRESSQSPPHNGSDDSDPCASPNSCGSDDGDESTSSQASCSIGRKLRVVVPDWIMPLTSHYLVRHRNRLFVRSRRGVLWHGAGTAAAISAIRIIADARAAGRQP